MHDARVGIQGAQGLIYAEDAEYFDTVIGDPAPLLADVETLRPYQDVDAVPFGPIREGLDNFVNDLNAGAEGRFGDITGGYQGAAMNGLMAELGC